jgi:hypothetical protein
MCVDGGGKHFAVVRYGWVFRRDIAIAQVPLLVFTLLDSLGQLR